MLKIVYIVLLGVILSSCASNYQDFDTYKGDMPFVEGTPTQELLEELPDNTPEDYNAIGEWLKKQIQDKKLIIHGNEKDNNIRLEWKD